MATVLIPLSIDEARFLPGTNFPTLVVNGTNVPIAGLSFTGGGANEAAYWRFKPARYGSGNVTLTIDWYAATATSGTVTFEAAIAAVTPETDSIDIESKALATVQSVTDTHLGTTGKRPHRCTITISNLDSQAANDEVWLRLRRTDSAGMSGEVIVYDAQLDYSDV